MKKASGNYKHGRSKNDPTFNIWVSMRRRCVDTNHHQYKNYGGKGVKVCDRWNSFTNFLEDMGDRPHKHSIVRLDESKGFEPDNCEYKLLTNQEKHGSNRVLTEDAVREIKKLLANGLSPYAISKMDNVTVCRQSIDAIKHGKTWKHITIE